MHDALDPEYTILKQRLARRIRYDKLDVQKMSLVDITAVAERTITDVSAATSSSCCKLRCACVIWCWLGLALASSTSCSRNQFVAC